MAASSISEKPRNQAGSSLPAGSGAGGALCARSLPAAGFRCCPAIAGARWRRARSARSRGTKQDRACRQVVAQAAHSALDRFQRQAFAAVLRSLVLDGGERDQREAEEPSRIEPAD